MVESPWLESNKNGRTHQRSFLWEFPKIRGTLFGGPYSKDPTIQGTILGSPVFGNSHIVFSNLELGSNV